MTIEERTEEIHALLIEFADANDIIIQKKRLLALFIAEKLKTDSGRRFDEGPASDSE